MNNISTILEAVGELDNTVLENAFNRKRKKQILFTVIAAAASLSLLVGFTMAIRDHVEFNGKPIFDYAVKAHNDVKIPPFEEMKAMGADRYNDFVGLSESGFGYSYFIDAKPSEVIKKYGIEPLINDNFSEVVDANDPRGSGWGDYPRMQVAVCSDTENPPSFIYFGYWLTDKQSGLPVLFMVDCYTERTDSIVHGFSGSNDDHELFKLKNGETAFVQQGYSAETGKYEGYSTFTYDGMVYHIYAVTDVDGMKQILINLGITAV